MNEGIRQLLADKHFQRYAADLIRAQGVQPSANPGHQLLTALYQRNPQQFPALIQHAVGRLEQHTAHMTRLQKLEAQFPAAKVAEAWKELPADTGLRAAAKRPEVIAKAKEALRQAGLVPLPGLSEADTLLAFVHAAEGREELLADAAPGVFGSANEARIDIAKIRSWHETKTTAQEIGDKQREHDEAVAKANGIKRPTPEERRSEVVAARDARDAGTGAAVAEAYDRQTRGKREKVYLRNKGDLAINDAYDRLSGETAQYEVSPNLKRELIEELRDEATVHEATVREAHSAPTAGGES